MEDYIQELLDAQWDALESRNNNVRSIRTDLYDAICQLAEQRSKDLSSIDTQIKRDRNFVQKETTHIQQRKELQSQLNREEASDRRKSIDSLNAQISSIDDEIRKLQERRRELDAQRQELVSTHSSRTAKFRDAIEDLNKLHPPENVHLVEEANKRILRSQTEKKDISTELRAATEGSGLWKKVCSELDSLDNELKGLKRDQLPQIAFLLTKASDKISGYLDIASDAGWSVLTIAIGHELQILHETQTAIQETVNRTDE